MPKKEDGIEILVTPGPKKEDGIDVVITPFHLATPEAAIVPGIAKGQFGDKVGVFGSTVIGVGVWGRAENTEGLAGSFEGKVKITGDCAIVGALTTSGNHVCGGDLRTLGNHTVDGDIQLSGADCAEDFDIVEIETAEPGTVMVLDESGGVRMSDHTYDRRVAGVVSGAGNYKPAVILDRQSGTNRRPLALMGKVYCRVDATDAPIAIGDLLTTSSTPGHAMKAADPTRAFGAVVGKALGPLLEGRGLVPILVALQ